MHTAISQMTDRERFVAALTFGEVDRIPFEPGGARKSTREMWYQQGLPQGADYMTVLREMLGLPKPVSGRTSHGVDFRMIPTFEEKVLEHRDGHYIVQDWMGNITEISDQYDYTYIRNAIDFVTRKWHKFPVENRADFESMKKRYDVNAPGRFPADFRERCKQLKTRTYPVEVYVAGPFWQMREWCGFEPLCMMFIDDPDFVAEMSAFWTGFVSKTLEPLLDAGVVDAVHLNEDMAYKEKSMISPAMAREHLLPAWSRWTREIKSAGVPVVDMDSDGKIDELIPLWIEAGINVCDPIEVAAGNDINEYRRTFGRKMAYRGGVDKRAMAKGGRVMEQELERIAPVVRGGGFIPGCDHGVPPDVSWPDYVAYARKLAELTGWL